MFIHTVIKGLLYLLATSASLSTIYVVYMLVKKENARLTDFESWIVLAAIWLNPDDCSWDNGKNSFAPSNAIQPLTNVIAILERNGLHNDVRYFKYYDLLLVALTTLSLSSRWGYTRTYFSSKDILYKIVRVEHPWSEDGYYNYIPIIPDGLLKDIRIREKRLYDHINPVSIQDG